MAQVPFLTRLLGIKNRMHPRLIPNKPSYRFVARLMDGTEVECETYQNDFTIRHRIQTVESKTPITLAQIQDWTEL